MKKVFILKCGTTYPPIKSRWGDFEDWFQKQINVEDSRLKIVDVRRRLPDLPFEDILGVIISGSHSMVTDQTRWMQRLSKWLIKAADNGVPILGICFGHQIIARTFGGKVDYHPKGKELGLVNIILTPEGQADPLFNGLEPIFQQPCAHSQSALKLPAEAILLAFNDHESHQAFRIGSTIWGLQFHPEFHSAILECYHQKAQNFGPTFKLKEIPTKTIEDNAAGKIILNNFLKIADHANR